MAEDRTRNTRARRKSKEKTKDARTKTKTKIKTKAGRTRTKTKIETKRRTRVRRTPEEARRLILDAARQVFAEVGPDAAGLEMVARRAGVSHGLITHYFGTFDGLVEETMAEHVAAVRAELIARLADDSELTATSFIETLFEVIEDPLYGRLAAWAFVSGRFESEDFFPRRERGPARVVDAVQKWLASRGARAAREDIELMLILVFTASVGYGVGKSLMWASLGHQATARRDRRFGTLLATVIDRELEARGLT